MKNTLNVKMLYQFYHHAVKAELKRNGFSADIAKKINAEHRKIIERAKEIGKSEELVSDENMEMLISLEEETALERTALIEADGTAHYDNGAEKNVSSRRYFKEGMEGKETLSDPLESSVDKETRVILGVPVWKNGKVIGVLGGSYNVTALSRMLFNDFFEDVGYTLITTSDGEIIA